MSAAMHMSNAVKPQADDAVCTTASAIYVVEAQALESMEQWLTQRACWYRDPHSYAEGVRAAIGVVRAGDLQSYIEEVRRR